MSFQIRAEILGNMDSFAKAMNKSAKQMGQFEKTSKQVSGAIKAAWAGVAALGLGAVYDAMVDVTKAAANDAKSTALLNRQMDNSWKATQKTKDEMSAYLDTLSAMSGIVDDELKPGLSKIISVTKSATKAQKYFSMAMDIAAYSGKDINTVSLAMAKFLGGNTKALDKIIPGLKDAGDKIGFITEQTKGMAAVAGQNDPFARINAVIDTFKEKLGKAFLPIANNFADWLGGEQAQKVLDDVAKKVQDAFAWFSSPEGLKAIDDWIKKISALLGLAKDVVDAVMNVTKSKEQKVIDDRAAWQTNAVNSGQFNPMLSGSQRAAGWTDVLKNIDLKLDTVKGVVTAPSISYTVTNNNTVNGAVSGNEVVTALTRYARGKGVPLSKLLG